MESGQKVAQYKLLAKIGEGGMGVVWSAEDTVLRRTVAIKFLPVEVTDRPERLARFQREARLLASLNHPNVSAIHGLEQDAGLQFLVLEHIGGEGLDQRLKRGRLPVEEAPELRVRHRDTLARHLQLCLGEARGRTRCGWMSIMTRLPDWTRSLTRWAT